MGVQDLHEFVETNCPEACKPVDLLKIARGLALSQAGKRRGPNQLCLVVDGESCLDRLYGGYYSDWACGGQWNRMIDFLNTLLQACRSAHMELVVFFDGSTQNDNVNEWHKNQMTTKRNAAQVFKHINNKATPPPKVWWVAPMCLRSALRLAFRHLLVPVASSVDNHKLEVIGYCRDNGYHGVLGHSADYMIFNPPRYFCSEHLKLTYKGALETTEYVNDDVAKLLDLHPKRFCVLAALLGSNILTEIDLEVFLKKVSGMPGCDDIAKIPKAALVKGVVGFVRSLESVDDLQSIGSQVFGNEEEKIARFKQSVEFYMNGTHEGYIRYRNKFYTSPGRQQVNFAEKKPSRPSSTAAKHESREESEEKTEVKEDWGDGERSKEKDLKPDASYIEADSGYSIEEEENNTSDAHHIADKIHQLNVNEAGDASDAKINNGKLKTKVQLARKSEKLKVPPEVLRIASDRHAKGLMHPWVYQMLTQGEVKIDASMEDENNHELPPITELFRCIRQNVFAILFDLNKQWAAYKKTMKSGGEQRPDKPDITYHEWVPTAGSPPIRHTIHAEPLDWLAPGVHRLWLGQAIDDKNRRLRAFLSCMKSDVPYMLNTSYVPQHMILLCATLRYLVLYSEQRVLRKHELDAFLATAVSPLLLDVETMQEMKLPMINSRGVQLGAIFMRGIEHAIFANDAVGAPIPWHMCCPWLFFDGKLFHFKLLKANNNTPLIDICDGHVEQMMRVERMRSAILQGVPMDLAFAKPTLPMMNPGPSFFPPPGVNVRPAGVPPMSAGGPLGYGGGGAGRAGHHQSHLDGRGGQLQIAGVVVGNWGPNFNNQPPSRPGTGRGTHITPPPHVMNVGPRNRSRGVVSTPAYRGGRGAVKISNRGGPPNRPQMPPHKNYNNDNQNYRASGGPPSHSNNYNNYGGSGMGSYNNHSFSSRGGSRGGNRGGHRPVGSRPFSSSGRDADLTHMTLEHRSRSQAGAGRGVTVENPIDSNIVSVHELMSADLSDSHLNGASAGASNAATVEIGTFADVDAELAMVDGGNQFDLGIGSM